MSKLYKVSKSFSEEFLGYYEGEIEDIALFLADKINNHEVLKFEKMCILKAGDARGSQVKISVSKHLFSNYNWNIIDHHIVSETHPHIDIVTCTIISRNKDEIIKRNALNKLSEDEIRVLGLKK